MDSFNWESQIWRAKLKREQLRNHDREKKRMNRSLYPLFVTSSTACKKEKKGSERKMTPLFTHTHTHTHTYFHTFFFISILYIYPPWNINSTVKVIVPSGPPHVSYVCAQLRENRFSLCAHRLIESMSSHWITWQGGLHESIPRTGFTVKAISTFPKTSCLPWFSPPSPTTYQYMGI